MNGTLIIILILVAAFIGLRVGIRLYRPRARFEDWRLRRQEAKWLRQYRDQGIKFPTPVFRRFGHYKARQRDERRLHALGYEMRDWCAFSPNDIHVTYDHTQNPIVDPAPASRLRAEPN